ncbi:uncharacterized protein LOC131246595 [Magnolia sinica]|uniref:uncharacterized protein LOC131246595 n=1 Tax=Magnolia sinica TaxID=86752 RepID=UPI002658D289|nr:uncharacterized protein LOC131246595 [Magnolia sinica]
MTKKIKDVIHLEPEPVISVTKPTLIERLTSKIDKGPERAEFVKFCKRVEYTIRARYLLQFEDMMQLYTLFNPLDENKRLKQQKITPEDIDAREQNFLASLFQILEKSNFKIVTDEEVENARSGKYLLNLPIEVDLSKLDSQLLRKYFDDHPHRNLPMNHDKVKYIIFRRGIGIDSTTGRFYMEKLDMIIERVWSWFLKVTRLQGILSRTPSKRFEEVPTNPEQKGTETKSKDLVVERIRIQNMELSMKNLYSEITIKEPTFDRMIVIYRRASTKPKEERERGIYVKHFKNIPMADMEIVLPEKKNPTLTPMDWLMFLGSAVIGLVALISSLERPKADIWVFMLLISGLVSYCAKAYFTFQQNLATYQNLITHSMYEKQLDSGRGTLLHLCDDVINQEVKEVIISFYILMMQGKEGNLTSKELDQKCEKLLKDEFKEECNFKVDDAVEKLRKLRIVKIHDGGRIQAEKLERANEIIGTTTEEVVLKAKHSAAATNESKGTTKEELVSKKEKQRPTE